MSSHYPIPGQEVDEDHVIDNTYHGISSEEPSADTSVVNSRAQSPSAITRKERGRGGRVRWNDAGNDAPRRLSLTLQDISQPGTPSMGSPLLQPTHSRNNSTTNVLVRHDGRRSLDNDHGNPFSDSAAVETKKPRPSVLRNNSATSVKEGRDSMDHSTEKAFSALAAQERAQRIATLVGSHSAPTSRRNSMESDEMDETPSSQRFGGLPVRIDDIPLVDMPRGTYDYSDDEEFGAPMDEKKQGSNSEAHKLVRMFTRKDLPHSFKMPARGGGAGLRSGQVTPTEEHGEDYVARPAEYRGGVLSALLKLQNAADGHARAHRHRRESSGGASGSPSLTQTPGSSGTSTPMRQKQAKWYNHKNQSNQTLANLIEASNMLSNPAGGKASKSPKSKKSSRPGMGSRQSSSRMFDRFSWSARHTDEARVREHIEDTLKRQRYLIQLCKALMAYGAPTHRLEEYIRMSARVLEIQGQFLYIPGCMLVSFDDATTHTTEVKLVRSAQGVDLGRLKDVHEIYKEVVHDMIGVEEAAERLDTIIGAKQRYHKWILVLLYGVASASVGPFAFDARWIDLPICGLLGCVVGFMQHILAPQSELYSNVFEVTAAVVTSFAARGFGSIPNPTYPDKQTDEKFLFCFSAAAQSSIALILPGYMVLCAALELQARSMVAGSVRMVYAIIYSLFLGFGITIGTTLFGLMYAGASSETKCANTMNEGWKFLFVAIFTLMLCIINQAKWKQMPVMLGIAESAYTVNFFSSKRFASSAQLSNTFGALVVGTLGNLHSRIRHGVAAASMLPAIFVQVPSGLAASGSLLAGLSTADSITNTTAFYANGTSAINGTSSVTITSSNDLNSVVLNVGYSMVQIAIGITVGLFLSALIIYPFGKRRSGLFSF